MKHAYVIGSGPNGLAAAIVLAQAGLRVEVFETEAEPGGAARTLPLTLPGFLHDFGSAVHPFAAGSPFFSSLPLADYGLEWVHGDAPLAHPLDDGSAILIPRDLTSLEESLGSDAKAWRSLVQPAVDHWAQFAADSLGPIVRMPRHPLLMARFGLKALGSAQSLSHRSFSGPRASALFAGLAAHSIASLDHPLTGAIGAMFAVTLHAVGWPVPRGGARAIPHALIGYLNSLGGVIHTGYRVTASDFAKLAAEDALVLSDTTPRALASIAGDRVGQRFHKTAERFRRAPGAFKVDYALSDPVPWKAAECRHAITVHLGGGFEEISASEYAVVHGQCSERPFVLAAQPTLFDPARAPHGKHVLWAYCHVPNGSSCNMTERIESQIERFAPGFRDCILARSVSNPADLARGDANLEGGDISGGALTLRQFLFRPGLRNYVTGAPNVYMCSASTPPGGGVHGMCGYHAARLALRRIRP
ncbi:MAG TPA: NAD(P)/FAD-dependent oxidoreductase [Terracidiphilus sp.]|nr:NAD(P)/FAD-dependent oxidoreductase [Terracidiphilus sp.]